MSASQTHLWTIGPYIVKSTPAAGRAGSLRCKHIQGAGSDHSLVKEGGGGLTIIRVGLMIKIFVAGDVLGSSMQASGECVLRLDGVL